MQTANEGRESRAIFLSPMSLNEIFNIFRGSIERDNGSQARLPLIFARRTRAVLVSRASLSNSAITAVQTDIESRYVAPFHYAISR
jgi:hypothetical protein